ncbi:hypothetical protein ON010_g264 [Phytophthora cinnamomi]|nr:hypothetical protein ON010_g264 [Phytophthora cinnamomi]
MIGLFRELDTMASLIGRGRREGEEVPLSYKRCLHARIPHFTRAKTAMRFRFGEGEEQLFVADILPLLDVEVEDEEEAEACTVQCTPSYMKAEAPNGGDSSSKSSGHCDGDRNVVNVSHSSRPRLQTKRKIERLRREIQTLGLELAGLQRAGRGGGDSAIHSRKSPTTSRWKAIAAKRLQQRQRAEHDNRVLKRMIAAQNMLARSILSGSVRLRASVGGGCAKNSSLPQRFPHITI